MQDVNGVQGYQINGDISVPFVRFTLDSDIDLEAVAEQCPMTLTGADFYALCSDAMLNAVKRKIDELEAGQCIMLIQVLLEIILRKM